MNELRFALLGAGEWAPYQIASWYEVGDVRCVAVYDAERERAEEVAGYFGINRVYTDAAALFANEQQDMFATDTLDFVVIGAEIEARHQLIKLAAERGIAIVCVAPAGASLAQVEEMVEVCETEDVPLYISTPWRWQHPLRQLKAAIDSRRCGKIFRAQFDFRSSYPIFEHRPDMIDAPQVVLADAGVHLLDVARSLFGDASTVYCQTNTIRHDIVGEDAATVMLNMENGVTVLLALSYGTPREHDRYPQTYIQVEGSSGFLELAPDYWLRETTEDGTLSVRHAPDTYPWATGDAALIYSALVPCHRNIMAALRGFDAPVTSGADHLLSMQLVYGAYASAAAGQVIELPYHSSQYELTMRVHNRANSNNSEFA